MATEPDRDNAVVAKPKQWWLSTQEFFRDTTRRYLATECPLAALQFAISFVALAIPT